MKVNKTNLKNDEIDVLKERGLKGTIQGPRKVNDLFDE